MSATKHEIADFYDVVAGKYAETQEDWDNWIDSNTDFFRAYLAATPFRSPLQVIDIAAGTGSQVIALHRLGIRPAAADISARSLALIPEGLCSQSVVAGWGEISASVLRPAPAFDLAVAMDNALAHALTPEALATCVADVRDLVGGAGRFLFSLRDYDAILLHRPVTHGSPRDRARGYWQEWEWLSEDLYVSTWFLKGVATAQVRSRAIRRAELKDLARAQGAILRDVPGYFQPAYEFSWCP